MEDNINIVLSMRRDELRFSKCYSMNLSSNVHEYVEIPCTDDLDSFMTTLLSEYNLSNQGLQIIEYLEGDFKHTNKIFCRCAFNTDPTHFVNINIRFSDDTWMHLSSCDKFDINERWNITKVVINNVLVFEDWDTALDAIYYLIYKITKIPSDFYDYESIQRFENLVAV